MKKVIVLAMATFLVTGVSFAYGGDEKCKKASKSCCKKEAKEKKETTTAKKA